jgi:hypothetical protein
MHDLPSRPRARAAPLLDSRVRQGMAARHRRRFNPPRLMELGLPRPARAQRLPQASVENVGSRLGACMPAFSAPGAVLACATLPPCRTPSRGVSTGWVRVALLVCVMRRRCGRGNGVPSFAPVPGGATASTGTRKRRVHAGVSRAPATNRENHNCQRQPGTGRLTSDPSPGLSPVEAGADVTSAG